MAAAQGLATVAGATLEETNSSTGYNTGDQKIPEKMRGFLSLVQALIVTTFPSFATLTTLIIAVARQASVTSYSGGMAGAAGCTAMINACPFLIYARFRVGHIEARRAPGSGRMAIRAIGLEGSKVEIRVSMAGHTLRRKPGKLPVRMATLASHIDMGAI